MQHHVLVKLLPAARAVPVTSPQSPAMLLVCFTRERRGTVPDWTHISASRRPDKEQSGPGQGIK